MIYAPNVIEVTVLSIFEFAVCLEDVNASDIGALRQRVVQGFSECYSGLKQMNPEECRLLVIAADTIHELTTAPGTYPPLPVQDLLTKKFTLIPPENWSEAVQTKPWTVFDPPITENEFNLRVREVLALAAPAAPAGDARAALLRACGDVPTACTLLSQITPGSHAFWFLSSHDPSAASESGLSPSGSEADDDVIHTDFSDAQFTEGRRFIVPLAQGQVPQMLGNGMKSGNSAFMSLRTTRTLTVAKTITQRGGDRRSRRN